MTRAREITARPTTSAELHPHRNADLCLPVDEHLGTQDPEHLDPAAFLYLAGTSLCSRTALLHLAGHSSCRLEQELQRHPSITHAELLPLTAPERRGRVQAAKPPRRRSPVTPDQGFASTGSPLSRRRRAVAVARRGHQCHSDARELLDRLGRPPPPRAPWPRPRHSSRARLAVRDVSRPASTTSCDDQAAGLASSADPAATCFASSTPTASISWRPSCSTSPSWRHHGAVHAAPRQAPEPPLR